VKSGTKIGMNMFGLYYLDMPVTGDAIWEVGPFPEFPGSLQLDYSPIYPFSIRHWTKVPLCIYSSH
jgi:hypothetical protein